MTVGHKQQRNINHVYLSDPHQHRQKEEYNNLLDNENFCKKNMEN